MRKIRIQTIGLQLEPSKSIRSFPPLYIRFKTILLFSLSLSLFAASKTRKTSPFHSTSRVRRKCLNRMKRMDKSNYTELPFAAYFATGISRKYIRYSRFDLRASMAGSCAYTFFFRPNFTPPERVTRYIDDIFGGSNINSIINQSGCLGERARSDLLVGR